MQTASTGQIYPTELELNKTTWSHDGCSYRDPNAKVLNIKFCLDSYEKRDTFSFSIHIVPPYACGVVISQLV